MMKILIFVTFLFLLVNCNLTQHPSDKELENVFFSNKTEFLKLSKMLEEDYQIVRLTKESIFYLNSSQKEVSEEKLLEYRKLLSKLKLDGGIHRDNVTSIRFIISTKGLFISSSEKSIFYSTKDVEPIVDSLDKIIQRDNGDQSFVYKKLDENWYLAYESW